MEQNDPVAHTASMSALQPRLPMRGAKPETSSFSQFVVRARVERSKQLLQSSTLDASQVSADAGWSLVPYSKLSRLLVPGVPRLGRQHSTESFDR